MVYMEGEKLPTIGEKANSIWHIYHTPIILGLSSLLLIVISLVLLIKTTQTNTPIQFSSEASVSGVLTHTITIDIEGAVDKPGVYVLPLDSRIEDAIFKAGGITSEADTERIEKTINRAAKLSDGAKIFIPSMEGSHTSINSVSGNDIMSDVNAGLINVNYSSQSELESLPGIGPVTARKIIDNRPYQTLEELVSKKAMGQSLYNKLKDQLSL